jgi:2-polyprenyl-3-methyl-5-hydroxy-6-metoxy-1,4-benzoquinol methylase
MIYSAVNPAVLVRVPLSARRVLDVGCGDGALGRAIKSRRPTEVVGITSSREEAARAKEILDATVSADLESADLTPLGTFDCIVCSHVLEHVREPVRLLAGLRHNLEAGGVVLVALPNTVHYRQRLAFLSGKFRYTDGGIMDRTHYRFFDWDTARALVRDAGLHLTDACADGGFPGSRFLGPARGLVDRIAVRSFPGAFGVQFVLTARDPDRAGHAQRARP